MNNDNFEQQFMQNIKTSTLPVEQNAEQKHSSTIILIVIIAFMVIQLILSIVMLFEINASSKQGYEEIQWDDELVVEEDEGTDGVYDSNDYLIAMSATCTAEDNTAIILMKDNTYQKLDANSVALGKGSYTITRGSVFKFTEPNADESVLFYDGYALTDGVVFYDCEATTTEETSTK